MGIQLSAVAHNLEQVIALANTPVDHIRLGYPYCQPLAEFLWPPDRIEAVFETVVKAGKIPQFQWLISPGSSAKTYVDGCLDIVNSFPQTEIVIGHWGGLGFSLGNIKLAADSLGVYNSDLVCLLREWGIGVIGLPLRLNTDNMLPTLINSSPTDTIFEYHLWGLVMSSHWWRCPAWEGNCNPQACAQSLKFSYQQVEFSLRGPSLWLTPGVDNLGQAQALAQLGIERGLIQLADIPPQAVAKVIDYCLAKMAGEQPTPVKAVFS